MTLFSTISLAYADSVQVVMAKGTASSTNCGDQCFSPNSVSIPVGGTVKWKNADNAIHTATSTDGTTFNTGVVSAGAISSVTFNNAGTFPYLCQVHPWMQGTIIVGDSSLPPTPTTPDNDITFIIKTDPNANANTDKSVYLAGDVVNINGYNFVGYQTITIQILDSNQNKIAELSVGTSSTGVFGQAWQIPANLKAGQYAIQINNPTQPPPPKEIAPMITVSGKVNPKNIDPNNDAVTLRIVGVLVNGESKNAVAMRQEQLQPDGSFGVQLSLISNKKGDYKVIANYLSLKVESVFTLDGKSSEILVNLPTMERLSDDNSDRGTAAMPDKKTPQYDARKAAMESEQQALQAQQAKQDLEKQRLALEQQRLALEKQKKELQQQKEAIAKQQAQTKQIQPKKPVIEKVKPAPAPITKQVTKQVAKQTINDKADSLKKAQELAKQKAFAKTKQTVKVNSK